MAYTNEEIFVLGRGPNPNNFVNHWFSGFPKTTLVLNVYVMNIYNANLMHNHLTVVDVGKKIVHFTCKLIFS